MNQEKIGKFIAKLRKEKSMTQEQLAEKMGVTDKSISRWENGKTMPDVSLFEPLCNELNISINELLNGEKISKDKIVESANDTIINTLTINQETKTKFRNIIKVLFILIIVMLLFFVYLFYKYKNMYPEIDLYKFYLSHLDSGYDVEKKLSYKLNGKNYDIYYYGIENVQLCNKKGNCYTIASALENKQIDIEEIRNYFSEQYELGNNRKYILYDGGTTIYNDKGYSVIFCNTLDGNKDIYIGSYDMADRLNGNYCGHEENQTKSFIRTYQIISAEIEGSDFIWVTLKQNNGLSATVKINRDNNIIVGKTYEFSFYAFDGFDDSIENIFKYCTLLKAIETDKILNEQINEDIYINDKIKNHFDLNELDNVTMEIKEGTLSNVGATIVITDLSGHKYRYGQDYRLDKFVNNQWVELENKCDNCVWDSIAYGPDKNNKLEFNHNWEILYGKLASGKYRLVKTILPNINVSLCEKDILYSSVEFEVK